MTDENNAILNNDAQASIIATIDVPKKQRKPRAKKATPETVSVDVVARTPPAKRGKQTKTRGPKAVDDASSATTVPLKRTPKAVQAPAAALSDAVDEMEDLLRLEEENQRLRKSLAEKLLAENADLRKRLNIE
jgi:hypothetical protein